MVNIDIGAFVFIHYHGRMIMFGTLLGHKKGGCHLNGGTAFFAYDNWSELVTPYIFRN